MNAEQVASFLVCSIFSVPVIFFAIILCCGKGADLIAGYNVWFNLHQQEPAFQKEVNP